VLPPLAQSSAYIFARREFVHYEGDSTTIPSPSSRCSTLCAPPLNLYVRRC
jgi:hypothetical protein